MFTHPQPHSCLHVITAANRIGKNLTFGCCLMISLLFHLAISSVIFVLQANVVRTPRKAAIVEIDLSRIEAASPKKASSPPTPISGPKVSANRHFRHSSDPIRTARPLQEKTSRTKADSPHLETGPGKEMQTKPAEMNSGGSSSGAKPSVSSGGAQGTGSGSGREESGDRPAGDGHVAKGGLAEYSRTIRALIERHKEYPLAARRLGIRGSVIVSFTVDLYGELRGVSLAKSSGNSMLDNAGIRAVSNVGRFPPPPRHALDGEVMSFRIPITFALTSG